MKIIFLDRDGVINKYPGDKNYVTTLKGFRFLPKSKAAIAKLYRKGFKLVIASNQAGVGKGIFTKKALDMITAKMLKGIRKAGGDIHEVSYCTHRPQDGCFCRKPRPGMIKTAHKKYRMNIKDSFFIGDTIRDVNTAKAAGCKSILVLSGKEKLSNRKNWGSKPDHVFKNLYQAAQFILKEK